MKNRKDLGPDRILNEMLKYEESESKPAIKLLFRKIISTQKVPTDWKNSITMLMYKKGNKNDPSSYRMNRMIKLFTKIITKKFKKKLK